MNTSYLLGAWGFIDYFVIVRLMVAETLRLTSRSRSSRASSCSDRFKRTTKHNGTEHLWMLHVFACLQMSAINFSHFLHVDRLGQSAACLRTAFMSLHDSYLHSDSMQLHAWISNFKLCCTSGFSTTLDLSRAWSIPIVLKIARRNEENSYFLSLHQIMKVLRSRISSHSFNASWFSINC